MACWVDMDPCRLTSRGLARGDAPSDRLHAAHQSLHQAAAVRHLERLLVFLLVGSVEGRRGGGRSRRGDGRGGSGGLNGRGGGRSGRGRHPG